MPEARARRKGGVGGWGVTPPAAKRSAGAKRRRSIRILRKMGSDFFKQTPPKILPAVLRGVFFLCHKILGERGRFTHRTDPWISPGRNNSTGFLGVLIHTPQFVFFVTRRGHNRHGLGRNAGFHSCWRAQYPFHPCFG